MIASSLRIAVDAEGLTSGGGRTWVTGLVEELAAGGGREAVWTVRVSDRLGLSATVGPAHRLVSTPPRSTVLRLLGLQTDALGGSDGAVRVHSANFGPLLGRGAYVLMAHNALHFQPVGGSGPWAQRLRVESALARASVRRAEVTVVPSQAMADLVHEATGRDPRVLPFGVRAGVPGSEPGDDRFTFVNRTTWGPHKNLGVLLEATRALGRRRPGAFLVWTAADPFTRFARGFAESRPERALMSDPVVRAHIRIAPFPDPGVSVGQAAVIPSDLESFCFPLAEAIASGLPAIVADKAWARELCGEAAMFVEAGAAVDLAAAMEAVLDGARPPAVAADRLARLSWGRHVQGLRDACADV
jgi:glycosyltransferase involved in cell wall biosynthesis